VQEDPGQPPRASSCGSTGAGPRARLASLAVDRSAGSLQHEPPWRALHTVYDVTTSRRAAWQSDGIRGGEVGGSSGGCQAESAQAKEQAIPLAPQQDRPTGSPVDKRLVLRLQVTLSRIG